MSGIELLQRLELERHPFPPTPDATSYFYTQHLQREYSEILHCIEARKGFMLITGEVGLGKTTLIRKLLTQLSGKNTKSALVFNTFLQEQALLSAILADFGLQQTEDIHEGIQRLNRYVIEQTEQGNNCVLFIDDAQNLTPASLELVRLLSNLETAQMKLLQVVLVGQPELEQNIQVRGLRQLRSRIIKWSRLKGLERDELPRYVEFRMAAAGASGRYSISSAAVSQIHKASGGNLRALHMILDRCLYGLAAYQEHCIDRDIARSALVDLGYAQSFSSSWFRPALAAAVFLPALLLGWWLLPISSQGDGMMAQAVELPAQPVARLDVELEPHPVQVSVARPDLPPKTQARPEPVKVQTTALPLAERISHDAPHCQEQLMPLYEDHVISRSPLDERLAMRVLELDEEGHSLRFTADFCLYFDEGPRLMWASHQDLTEAGVWEALDEVSYIQQRLSEIGLMRHSQVDGLLGPVTRAALGRFQESMNIEASYAPDPLTLMLLEVTDDNG